MMTQENLLKVRERIRQAALGCGRDPSSITLIAVTKNVVARQICEALDAGIAQIGENRVQEAFSKRSALEDDIRRRGAQVRWHLIGHLQTNKVKDAVRIFDVIHSVDSIRLLEWIDKEARHIAKVQDILLEVRTSREATKFGFSPLDLADAVVFARGLESVNLAGLMTMAPQVDDPQKARPYFRKLKELSDEIFGREPGAGGRGPVLSMGMTDDFEAAIQEGATMVRIGRGIFGERNK